MGPPRPAVVTSPAGAVRVEAGQRAPLPLGAAAPARSPVPMLLDDHAAMYLSATRAGLRPCIGLVKQFDEVPSREAVGRWAATLAGNPLGFGRRVVGPRIPGARARWMPDRDLPPIRYVREALGRAELHEVLEEEVSSLPDPAHGIGWRVAAARVAGGGMCVTLWLNHAYGDARAILSTAFDQGPPGSAGEAGQGTEWRPEIALRTAAEMNDLAQRLGVGVRGSARLGRDVLGSWLRSTSPGDLERLRPVIAAIRRGRRQPAVRSPSRRLALAQVPAAAWKEAARRRGGSENTLLVAFLANLLRGARRARGEEWEGPLRIILPIDTRRRQPGGGGQVTDNAATGATILLHGAETDHRSLDEVRQAVRRALVAAASSSRRGGPTTAPLVVDAFRLLPSVLSHRLAVLGQTADGVASNIGAIPRHVGRLGAHQATHVYLLGGPMMTDLTACLGRVGDDLTIGCVADAGRLGPGGTLPERVAAELDAWDLPARVW